MKRPHKGRLLLTLALAVLIALAAAGTVIFLHGQADKDLGSAALLAKLEEQSVHLMNLELEAVAAGRVDRQLLSQVAERREAVNGLFGQLARRDPSGQPLLRAINTSYARFIEAQTYGLRLAARGQVQEAARFDRGELHTRYGTLEQAIEEASAVYVARAGRSTFAANAGSLAVSVAALALIGFLLWGFGIAQRAAAVQAAEKNAMSGSEEHFRKLIQFSSDVTLLLGPQGRVQYVGESARGVLGYRSEELCGKTLIEVVHPDDADLARQFVKECARDGDTPTRAELRVASHDGRWLPLEAIGTNRLDDPTVNGIIVNARDITKRKQAEELVEAQKAELEERNAEVTALYDVSEALGRATSTTELFDLALESMDRIELLREWQQGGILVAEGDGLKLAAHREREASARFLELHEHIEIGQCLCGLAAKKGEIIVSEDSRIDERHTLRCPGVSRHGHIIVPLRAMGKVEGVMYLYTDPDVQIEERLLKLLQAIGDRIGAAIETVRLHENTRELSLRDPLTGLANRRLMHIELDKSLARARRVHRPFSVIMLDLDHFKDFNDTYGHAGGDRLLADLASIIQSETREMDLAVRYGGEEFLVVLPETRLRDAAETAERIRKRVMDTKFHPSAGAATARITISTGVAAYNDDVASDEEVTQMADKALYAAKEKGRNRVELWAA